MRQEHTVLGAGV